MGYWGMMLFGYYEMEMDIIDYCFSGILSFSSFFNPSDWLLSLIAIMHTLLLQIACSNHFGHSNRQHLFVHGNSCHNHSWVVYRGGIFIVNHM